MTARTIPRAPNGLAAPGRSFFREVAQNFELRPDEVRLLEACCRTLDEIARLETALAGAELTVLGAQSQVLPHPLIAAVRAHRDLARKLVAQLRLPDASGVANTASQPSRVRWDRKAVAAK